MWRDFFPPCTFIATANQMNPRDYGALVQPALWLNLDFIKHMVHTFLKVEFIARWWFHGWNGFPQDFSKLPMIKRQLGKWYYEEGSGAFPAPVCYCCVSHKHTVTASYQSRIRSRPRESWSLNPIRLLTDRSPGSREYPNSSVYLKKY